VAVLFSTHDPEDAAAIAEAVLVLHRGRVVATGTPAAITAMADGFVSTITVTTPLIPHFAGCAVVRAAREGERLHLRVVGEPPPGAAPVPPRLEDAYALLTRDLA
jgi:ABC-type multidrug transport system ATPase subunit